MVWFFNYKKLKDESIHCKNEFDLFEDAQEYNNKLYEENKIHTTTKVWQNDDAEYAQRI